MQSNSESPIIIAMTGASGAAYGLRLLECVLAADRPVYFMVSKAAQMVLATETELDVPAKPAEMEKWFTDYFQASKGQLTVFGRSCNIFAACWIDVVTVNKVEKRAVIYTMPQRMYRGLLNLVPTHVGDFQRQVTAGAFGFIFQ